VLSKGRENKKLSDRTQKFYKNLENSRNKKNERIYIIQITIRV